MNDMITDETRIGWRHLVLAYNAAKNAGKHDTAGSLAFAIAEASAVLEYLETMNGAESDAVKEFRRQKPEYNGRRIEEIRSHTGEPHFVIHPPK